LFFPKSIAKIFIAGPPCENLLALDADNKILSGPSDQLVWRIIRPLQGLAFIVSTRYMLNAAWLSPAAGFFCCDCAEKVLKTGIFLPHQSNFFSAQT
jgi:hypothetical protein